MIMCMSDVLVITNRKLCKEDFFGRIEALAAAGPKGIILREKDLPEAEYLELARQTAEICDRYQTPCVLHSFPGIALELGVKRLHLPLPILRNLSPDERAYFTVLGASCHSAEDAREAEALGCTYITAGHVFDTDCKKGLPGRGLEFLKQVCESVRIPVYAIGGIDPENYKEVMAIGAAGVCVMSGAMVCEVPGRYLSAFSEKTEQTANTKKGIR